MAEPTDLADVRRRRDTLYEATLALETAIAAPAGSGAGWGAGVAKSAHSLTECIDAHAREVEEPGGFLESIIADAPRLFAAAKRLEGEHTDLKEQAESIGRAAAAMAPDADGEIAEVRERAMELMNGIISHRQRGADLIYEAYQVDAGSSD